MDDIKIDIRETDLECVGWIHSLRDRDRWRVLTKEAISLQVPSKSDILLTSSGYYQLNKNSAPWR